MNKKWTIALSEVPDNITVEKFIRQKTNIESHIQNLKRLDRTDYISASINLDQLKVIQEIQEFLSHNPTYSFEYKGREEKFESYQSCSLTWNPEAIDKLSPDPLQSGLGSALYSEGSSNYYEKSKAEKNTYADTYSFLEKTPLAHLKSLEAFFNSFNRTMIRSRISIIKASHVESTKLQYLWHKDESIFLNLRINIPIESNDNYVIQLLNEDSNEADIKEFSLECGKAYVYDTEKLHRPFCKKLNSTDRINMICGVSPWFNYNPEQKAWVSNEFFGELHPFDMFSKGLITPMIRL